MALEPTIALFIWGKDDLSPYAHALLSWASERENVTVFRDTRGASKTQFHYLRFHELMRHDSFDLIVHDIADSADHAAAFHFLIKWPSVLFLNTIALPTFARRTSYSADDPWGYRWILNVVVPEQADKIAQLNDADIDAVFTRNPLAYALALRSAAVVVPDYNSALLIENKPDVPPLSIIEIPDSESEQAGFDSLLDKMLPLWRERTAEARNTISAINHPHLDMKIVERKRLLDQFDQDHSILSRLAIDELEDLLASS